MLLFWKGKKQLLNTVAKKTSLKQQLFLQLSAESVCQQRTISVHNLPSIARCVFMDTASKTWPS